ncbi:MAG: PEP-CTERM sorting domain-containing protein [Planctomycetes bacterium]|nr:PEP-CTERM sorting domain-containing protein [Planctomycetota bacterium]
MKSHRILLTTLLALALLVSFASTARAGALADVSPGEMAGYNLLYAVDNNQFDFNDAYTVDNSAGVDVGSFTRVGYYVQLDGNWVWASMDTFNTDPTMVGVPRAGTNIVETGTLVNNLNVQSNHANLTSLNGQTGLDGIIEFWASNYNGDGGGLYGSDNGRFDWKDSGGSTGGGHSSFQVFARPTPTTGTTLFGITGNGGSGIGDQYGPGGGNAPDWTFGPGTGTYATRNLEIWTFSSAPDTLTWDGVTNGNFNSTTQWTGGSLPTPDDTMVAKIGPLGTNNTVTVSADGTAYQVEITGNGALNIGSGNTLDVVQTISASGRPVGLAANSTLNVGGGEIGTLTTTGNATVGSSGGLSVDTLNLGSGNTLTKDGAGALTITGTGNTIDGTNTIKISGGALKIGGADPLHGANLNLDGARLTVQGTQTEIFGQIDWERFNGGQDLNNLRNVGDGTTTGGLLGMTPTSSGIWTGPLNDPGSGDNYAMLYTGFFTAPSDGTFSFYTHGDDQEALYIDLNQDGVFTSADERITDNIDGGWNEPKTGTVTVTGGQSYAFAFAAQENTGGEFHQMQYEGQWVQTGLTAYGDVNFTGPITVTANSELEAISGTVATFDAVTVNDGAALTMMGDVPGITFTQAILPGGRGTYKPEVPTTLTETSGLSNPGGVASTLVAAGTADLILNKAPVNSMANVTLEAKSGRLFLDYANGDPTGGADLDATGGTITVQGAGVTIPDAIGHYGYHINNDGLAMDLNNNAGMMGGGDPTTGPSFFGKAFLKEGPGNRGLDFNDDTDFRNTGAIGQNDNYSNLWTGTLHVDAANAGNWEFRNAGDDDRAGIWLDLDQDGVFESSTPGLGSNRNEQLSWEDGGTKTVSLAAGDYLVGFTHREGGGGSRADFRFKSPTMGGQVIVKPADPAQADLWTATGIGALDMQNTLTVDNMLTDALRHLGYHTGPNGVMDLNNNNNAGGMMGGGDPTQGPTFFGEALLTTGPGDRGLDFNDDTDFRNTGAIGQNDNYSNLWLATLHVDAANAGTWEFRNRGDDDRAGIWLDLDQDGIFESSTAGLGSNRGEQLSWEDGGWKSVNLAAGDYLIAFTHSEGGGGSRADFAFRQSIVTGDAEWVIKPADAGQAGIFLTMPTSTLELVTDLDANLRELVLKNGDLRITGGSLLTVEQASVSLATSGTVGLITETETILTDVTGFEGNGQTVEITKSGAADLILNKAGTGLDNATFIAKSGRLVGVQDSGNPFGGAALGLDGSELVLSSAGGDKTYDNALGVTADSTLTAGAAGGGVAGPLTVTLGSAANGVTIDSGVTLNMRSTDAYSLNVAGALAGGNVTVTEGNVALVGGGTVANLEIVGGNVGTGANNVAVSDGGAFKAGPLKIAGSGSPFTVGGDNMAAGPQRLGLSGGTVTVSSSSMPGGLEAWFDASRDVTVDGSNNVTAWADQSGNGRDAVTYQGTGNLTAGEINGLPAVLFGENENLEVTGTEFFAHDTYMVFRSDSGTGVFGPNGGGWGSPFGPKDNGNDNDRSWMFDGGDDRFWNGETPGAVSWNGDEVGSANTFDMSGVAGAGGSDMSDYMVLKVTAGSANNLGAIRTYTLGTRNDQWSNLQFATAEILAFDHALTPGEENDVGGYLADKYGINAPNYTGNIDPPPIDLPFTDINVSANATLHADTPLTATFGNLDMAAGVDLTLSGADAGFIFNDVSGGHSVDRGLTIRGGIAPGVGVESDFGVGGNLVFDDTAGANTYDWDLGPDTDDDGIGEYDTVRVSGDLTLGDWTLALHDLGGEAAEWDPLALFTGFSNVTWDPAAVSFDMSDAPAWLAFTQPEDLRVEHLLAGAQGPEGLYLLGLQTVPEPSTIVLMLLGGLGLLAVARRRRRTA